MTVLATAGHVDHGKSTLVNFLTGQETDRLKEEKQRGLTINLGYTHFDYEDKRFSIVDVPGHSDYFKNTISGFSNVDGVLFCVDSTQGWSQQSEEHFLSLINLGINNLIFFLTKIDKIFQCLSCAHIRMKASTPIFKLEFWSVACKYINASYWDTLISLSILGFVAISCHSKIFLGAILL